MSLHSLRRLSVTLALGLIITLLAPSATQAQTSRRCFAETGFCIAGSIRSFWERNGGLPVFGLPITPLQSEQIEGRSVQVQWFERNRLELHPEHAAPYDVLLGRLGADRLGQAHRSSTTAQAPAVDCRLFAETGHNVCGAILGAWHARGLDLNGIAGANEAESLALFGLPLSDAHSETLADGRQYTVQWFERGRFELHPENAAPYDVLLGLLGREAAPIAQMPAVAPPVRMVIPAINLDQRIVAVGIDTQAAPIVPDHDIGWFESSAMPRQGDNIVFWGHVLRFTNAPQIPAPFARLKSLQPGAQITLYDSAGRSHAYVVTQQLRVRPNEVAYILPQGHERITMVSCIGDQVIAGGEVVDMSHRLITIAEPAS